ncbi:hypothetical protein, partial [Flavobacterium sp.]|uniref:hypothetical protein n=1 Tax=Flavobacterium sp. TaxID=239 RepID=UPI0026328CF2
WTFFVGKKDEKFMLSEVEVSPIIRTKSPNFHLDFFCGQKGREVYAERSRSKSYLSAQKVQTRVWIFFISTQSVNFYVKNLFF